VDHQVEEPLHLGLKGELLPLLSHAKPPVARSDFADPLEPALALPFSIRR
jgi:hypothetical protein